MRFYGMLVNELGKESPVSWKVSVSAWIYTHSFICIPRGVSGEMTNEPGTRAYTRSLPS